MSKIIIDVRNGVDLETAMSRVKHVISEGRVSKNNTLFCFLTTWVDGITVHTREYRKNDCFVVTQEKRENG